MIFFKINIMAFQFAILVEFVFTVSVAPCETIVMPDTILWQNVGNSP